MFREVASLMNNVSYGIEGWSGTPHHFGETPFAIAFGNIHWYGIFWAIGIFVSVIIIILKLRFFHKVSYDPFFYFIFPAIIVILLGSRTWSFIIGDTKIGTPFFDFKTGGGISGLAVHGGVIFCSVFGVIWFSLFLRNPKYFVKVWENNQVYFRKVSIWVFADAIIPTILIGQAIGRWGNFFNHEIYGNIVGTPLPDYPNIYDPGSAYNWLRILMPGVYEHMFIEAGGKIGFRVPLFLIESFFNSIFFIFLYGLVEQIKGYKSGILTGSYFLFYGVLRLVLEQLRDTKFEFITSIVTSVLFLVLGLSIILFNLFLTARFRKYRVWFMIYIYLTFWCKNISYSLLPKDSQRRVTFNLNKKNLGYNKKKEFKRTIHEMIYYHDEPYWGPFIIWFHNLFYRSNDDKKILSKTKIKYTSSDDMKEEIEKSKIQKSNTSE